jgi:hypothetical protein
MKELARFLVFLIIGGLIIFVVLVSYVCGTVIWHSWHANPPPTLKTPEELLAPLSEAQINCVNQVVGSGKLIQIALQNDPNFIGVGYINSDGLFAAMLDLSGMRQCQIEFQEQQAPAPLKDWQGRNIQPYFHKIQWIELTGDNRPDIYLWYDEYGTVRSGAARHKFYIKQSDGAYKDFSGITNVMCRGWSAVKFVEVANETRPKIVISNDVRCDWWGPGTHGTSYYEVFLNNDGVESSDSWREEETPPEFWYKP